MELLSIIGVWALPILCGIATILLVLGAKKLLDYLGVKRSDKIDDMIDRYVEMGISAAESAGRAYLTANGEKLDSESKKAKAIKTVLTELDQSGITGVAKELISDRIEHWLDVNGHNPGTPSDPPQAST